MSDPMALARQINKATIVKIARNNYSPKSSSMQFMESMTESDVCLLLDFDPAVESYCTQPDSFHNETKEPGWRRYTPDLLVKYKDGSFDFQEVKPESKTQSEQFHFKHALHQRIIQEQTGHTLKLVIEPQVPQHRLTQCRQLKGYYHCELMPCVNDAVCTYIAGIGYAELSAVEALCVKCGAPNNYPMVMLAHQLLRCVEAEIITRRSLVEVVL
jgi:hypothetical protein